MEDPNINAHIQAFTYRKSVRRDLVTNSTDTPPITTRTQCSLTARLLLSTQELGIYSRLPFNDLAIVMHFSRYRVVVAA